MSTNLDNLSSLPLLSESNVESIQISLSVLTSMLAGLNAGKLPSTAQATALLQRLLASDLLQPQLGSRFAGRVGGGQLSKSGREFTVALREVLEAVIRIGLEKNNDDKIQRFLYLSKQADVDIQGNIETPDIPLPSSKEIREVKESLSDLLQILLSSSELRALLADSVNLVRDLFADSLDSAAQASIKTTRVSKKLSKKIRPEEEEREGRKTGLEGINLDEIDTREMKKKVVRKVEDVRDDAIRSLERKRREAMSYVDEQLPSDVKDLVVERFKDIVEEIQSDVRYEESIGNLLDMIKKYGSLSASAIRDAAAASVNNIDVEANKSAETASSLFRSIIESFAGDLTPVFNSVNKLVKHVQNSSELTDLLKRLDHFLGRAIHDPAYITTAKFSRRAEGFYDEFQALVTSNKVLKKDIDDFVKAVTTNFEKAKNDRALSNLGDKLEVLGEKATRFGTGAARAGKKGLGGLGIPSQFGGIGDLLNDISQVMLPRFIKVLKSVPLPRIEYTSPDFDIAIDNILFESASFLPDLTRFENHLDFTCKRGYAAFASTFSNSTTIYISGLRLAAKDISYYLNKKTGWIGVEDAGLLDIYIGTEGGSYDGLDVTITVDAADEEDQETFFTLKTVEVHLTNFNISIHDSLHPIRNFFAKPALRTYIEARFVEALQEFIAESFRAFDNQLFILQQRSIGVGKASPDLASYLQAIFTIPFTGSSSSAGIETQSNGIGITKISKDGNSILAIGVTEELLPGKLTGLGRVGKDIIARKRGLDILAEEGVSTYQNGIEGVEGVLEDLRDEGERLEGEMDTVMRKEGKRDGWRSKVFDL